MRVILEDGFAISKGTGIGQYSINVLQQLEESPQIKSVKIFEKPFIDKISSASLRRAYYIAWLNSKFQLLLFREQPKIVHFTNYLIPTLKLTRSKYVVTIHDLAAWKFPETFPPNYVPYIKHATIHAIKGADLILTVSENVKEEIIDLFGIEMERIRTVYNTINKKFWTLPKKEPDEAAKIKTELGIIQDFLLFVGNIEDRKNVTTLIKAFSFIRDQRREIQLVLVGGPGYGFEKIIKYLEKPKLKDSVIMAGYIPEDDLITLYDLAAALIFPSLYEGFGRALVEAMTRGTPIVASRIPTTEEIAGEAVLYYSNPLDYKALAEQILNLLERSDLRKSLIERGVRQAQNFAWEKVGMRHLEAYLEII